MINFRLRNAVAIAALVVLTSCAQMQEREGSAPVRPAAMKPASAAFGLPARPAQARVESIQPKTEMPATAPAEPEKRFDVDVRDVDVTIFLRGLVEESHYSVAINPGVSGKISLSNLKNVSVPEVMEALADTYYYDIRRKQDSFRVFPAELQTRTFQVNYLNLKRTGNSKTRVTSGQITENYNQGGNTTAPSQQTQNANNANSIGTGSNIITESDSNFWKEIEHSLRLMIKEGKGHSLVISPEAGLVVVHASGSVLKDVANYLSDMHFNMHQQVILEAKIIEVTLKDGFQAGINWGLIRSNLFLGQLGGSGSSNTGTSDFANSGLTINPGTGTPIINGGNSIASTAIGGAFVGAINVANFNMIVELLSTQGDVKVLSSPQVSTVNNQKAIIKVGTDAFYVTGLTSDITTGTAITNSSQIQLTPFFSGIALDVTPRVYDRDQVILHVHPTVSEVTEVVKSIGVQGQTQSLPLAVSNLRESDSIVKARSGQVIVIGGLMQDRATNNNFAVPFLSDIPYLGNLFKRQQTGSIKSELVILLRPIVVENDDIWNDQINQSQARFDKLPKRVGGDDWANIQLPE